MKNEFEYLNNVKMDFSKYETEELNEDEVLQMKKVIKKDRNVRVLKISLLVACISALAVFSQTAFAQNMFANIVKSISIDSKDVNQTEYFAEHEFPKNFLFDKDGNPAEKYEDSKTYYDKNGDKINFKVFLEDNMDNISPKDTNTYITYADPNSDPLEIAQKNGDIIIKDIKELDKYLNFKARLPKYLPDGYSFYGATTYAKDGDYMSAYYKNQETGKWFMIDENVTKGDIKQTTRNKTEQETQINGHKATIGDEKNVDWEENGISIGVASRDALNLDEALKVAQSLEIIN